MKDFFTGLTGLGASIITTPLLTDGKESAIMNALVQLVIAVVTVFKLFKSRKK